MVDWLHLGRCLFERKKTQRVEKNLFVYSKVPSLGQSMHRLSPICDEQLIANTNTLANSQHFPIIIPSDDNPICSTITTTATSSSSRNSIRSPSHQATLFARRHFHVYDWTRLSFYDNVPAPAGYQSEPSVIENRSSTGASLSSTDEPRTKRSSTGHLRCSADRKDSGLGASSVERKTDSLVVSNSADPLHRSSSSISISSSASSLNNDATNPVPSASASSSRLPTSRKIRVKWHSFTKSHRPSFNSSKYHLGQMSVGQLFALRRAASIRLQELLDTTRILSTNKDEQILTLGHTAVATPQSLLATAFSAVPKLIIRRHQQRKVNLSRTRTSLYSYHSLTIRKDNRKWKRWRNPSLVFHYCPWLNARDIPFPSPFCPPWSIFGEHRSTVWASFVNRKWADDQDEFVIRVAYLDGYAYVSLDDVDNVRDERASNIRKMKQCLIWRWLIKFCQQRTWKEILSLIPSVIDTS